MTSARKSKISVRWIASLMSSFCKVLRLLFSLYAHPRSESSRINISHALAKRTGASALIILTSSSLFMMRLIRAKGRSLWFLKSCSVSTLVVPSSRISRSWSVQKPWSMAPNLLRNSGDVAEQTGPESSSRGSPDISMGVGSFCDNVAGVALTMGILDEWGASADKDGADTGAAMAAPEVVGFGTVVTCIPAYSAAAFCFRKVACRSAISVEALVLIALSSEACLSKSFCISASCAVFSSSVGAEAKF
mmetsp:Transcript_33397/g.98468  ORF Transcript_33397/g.98468 Transcript_33397/m.98468 type:complete len:248 (-) Transcript_33397:1092-1835(-)